MAKYAIEFQTMAVDSEWNSEVQQGLFLSRLSEDLKDELVVRDEPEGLDALISLAIHLDNRLKEQCQER